MSKYPYRSSLRAPGNWTSIDFSNPKLSGALKLMVHGIQEKVNSFEVEAGISIHKEKIKSLDDKEIDCFVFEPEGEGAIEGAILYCHGGGFFLPIQPMMMHYASRFAKELKVRVYLPEYRILPEYCHPYPFNDCLAVLHRVLTDNVPYLLYGESAGATLCAGISLWNLKENNTPAKGQCLIYPVLDNRCSKYPSMRLYSEAAWPLKNNLAMWMQYLKNGKVGLDDFVIPMMSTLTGSLPKTYIEPQEIDTLRDEAIAYAKKLQDAGNDVTLNLISGSYHGFDEDVTNPFVQAIVNERIQVMKEMLLNRKRKERKTNDH